MQNAECRSLGVHDPPGVEFHDAGQERSVRSKLFTRSSWKGLIAMRDENGSWVTYRKATQEDLDALGLQDTGEILRTKIEI